MSISMPLSLRSVDHDVQPGYLDRCQICGSNDLRLRIDLGHQPLCDALLTKEQLKEPETHYPLRLMQCEKCSLAQLDYVVDSHEVYPQNYPYRAGISWPVVAAHKEMASNLIKRYGKGLCVDIGCNDGTLLSMFQADGCDVLGFEPTSIAAIATEAGVPTVQAFFTEHEARLCRNKAHIITLTNVFAHMRDLGEVMRGISHLLATDGVLVIENHYLLDILEKSQFDSIYHEHIRTYTLKSLIVLFSQYNMEIFDAERVSRYGGNIRVHVAWKGQRTIQSSVSDLLAREGEANVTSTARWVEFCGRVNSARDDFRNFIAVGRYVVGCSAPGRASTLLNYFGIDVVDLPYTGELAGSLKLGMYLPGCHIPVLPNKKLIEERPDHIVLLAWHYSKEIATRLYRENVTAIIWTPLPKFSKVYV